MKTVSCLLFLKKLPHYGEPCVRTGNVRTVDGVQEAEVRLIYCVHEGEKTIWIRREDI